MDLKSFHSNFLTIYMYVLGFVIRW